MQDKSFVPFTQEMKKDYKILVPNMLPIHFKLIMSVLKTYGYNMELLETNGEKVLETGLKYTHNDTCYPAIVVIGQFMEALLSGRYDTNKVALIMFQTGGGCRASNYISLIRKALKKAGLEHIPVISLSFSNIEKHPGFSINFKTLLRIMYAVIYGDVMMSLVNQIRPYEKQKGSAQNLSLKWTKLLAKELGSGGKTNYKKVKENIKLIRDDFAKIKVQYKQAVKVGIVGEIFVKYSPLANNHLEDFLVSEDSECVVPGLLDFCLYCLYNYVLEYKLFNKSFIKHNAFKFIYSLLCKKKNEISNIINETKVFKGWTPFEKIVELGSKVISTSVKMGEGWLLTAEMLELASEGCTNIVCTQPFGCLPNHICGKGMMKPIKEKNSDINIVAIDYDAGASKVNQENRLKLMLFNARRNMEEKNSNTNYEKSKEYAK